MTTQHIVEVHIAKSKKALDEGVYHLHHDVKFPTKEEADEFLGWFNRSCDRNRRAVYIGESENERTT